MEGRGREKEKEGEREGEGEREIERETERKIEPYLLSFQCTFSFSCFISDKLALAVMWGGGIVKC